jgi:hypothetical protein
MPMGLPVVAELPVPGVVATLLVFLIPGAVAGFIAPRWACTSVPLCVVGALGGRLVRGRRLREELGV